MEGVTGVSSQRSQCEKVPGLFSNGYVTDSPCRRCAALEINELVQGTTWSTRPLQRPSLVPSIKVVLEGLLCDYSHR